jgi:phage host-nuclease inhibitor protein Gam
MQRVDSWEAVDTALRNVGELEIKIAEINGNANLKINAVKEEAARAIAPFAAQKDHVEKLITLYCEGNKAAFADRRSKQFTFGEVGYRLVKSVGLPRVKEKLTALIEALKAFGLGDCVKTEETIDKEAIVELEDASLVKLGLKRVVRDSFRITPKLEAIEPAGGER